MASSASALLPGKERPCVKFQSSDGYQLRVDEDVIGMLVWLGGGDVVIIYMQSCLCMCVYI